MTVKLWTLHGGNIDLPKDHIITSHKRKELTSAISEGHQE
jgi:hypothetical protein